MTLVTQSVHEFLLSTKTDHLKNKDTDKFNIKQDDNLFTLIGGINTKELNYKNNLIYKLKMLVKSFILLLFLF